MQPQPPVVSLSGKQHAAVDIDGNPTTDPNDYYSGGAILPVGVDQGHKGYALSFMVEVFSGLLTASTVLKKDLTNMLKS